MRRTDVSLSDDDLIELLRADPVGRRDDISGFLHTLESVEGGFSFLLDAGWGEGKTVFCRQVEIALRSANPILVVEANKLPEALGIEVSSSLHSYLPVYYNAWENDYWEDPLPSIGATIAAAGQTELHAQTDVGTGDAVKASLGAVLELTHLGFIANAAKEMQAKDLIERYRDRNLLRHRVDELIESSLREHANKMLLIIDELDRCRPDFALRVLEEVKNLFTSDELVILCAVNVSQLAKAVEGAYGSGMDGGGYLERFFDARVYLSQVAKESYFSHGIGGVPSDWFNIMATKAVAQLKPSLRVLGKVLAELKEKHDEILRFSDCWDRGLLSFAAVCLAPQLIILKNVRFGEFERVKDGVDAEPIVSLVLSCEESSRCFEVLLGDILDKNDIPGAEGGSTSDDTKKTIVERLVGYMFSANDSVWPQRDILDGATSSGSRQWRRLGRLVSS